MKPNKGNILIIGASSGLGKAIAARYASQGWKVGVCARREGPLRELHRQYPDCITWCTLDVTAEDAAQRFRDFADSLGGVDVVLYAAGCGWNNPMLREADDERTVNTNVVGFTRIANAVFNYFAGKMPPYMPRGRFAAITSVAGTKGIGISATYSATKRYQWTYLEALAQLATVRKVPLDITDIRPGFIDTPLLDTATHSYPMLMRVDYAVRRIVRAIERGRKVACIDWRWAAVVAVWKAIPRRLWIRLRIRI